MPVRGDVFGQGQYYHIYNRGAGKSRVFYRGENYKYCISLLERYSDAYQIAVIAYCMMPNHYHFLLYQEEEIPVSKLINVLFNAYVQAVNKEQERSGALFEGRFRHKCVEKDEYLVHLSRYIHLNPVSAGLVNKPEQWPYSDYLNWIGKRSDRPTSHQYVYQFFKLPRTYQKFVMDYHDTQPIEGKMRQYIFEES